MAYSNQDLYDLTQTYGNPSEGVDTSAAPDNSAGYALITPGESRYYHTGLEHEPSQAATGATPSTYLGDTETSVLGQSTALQSPSGEKRSGAVEVGKSQSYKGTPAAKISQRDKELQDAQKQADVQAGSYYESGNKALETAKASGIDAVTDMVAAEKAKVDEQGRQARIMGDMQKEWMEEEKKINMLTASKAEQAKADYLGALMEYRAAGVNPSLIWDNMKGGARFGTLVSVFAHDFLGAQGVKTSTMDTINRAIDRSIDAQIQAIKIKGEVTQGFKQLWDMQRQQSASDLEARTRVRGFMLESLKQGLVAEMSKYDSALVSARGKQALAKIDEEYAKNVLDVNKHIAQNAVQLRQQATSWAGDKVRAGAEAYSASVRLKVAEMEDKRLREAAAAKSASKRSSAIIDPATNIGKWVFKEGISDTLQTKVREQIAGVTEVNTEIKRLRELARQMTPGMLTELKPGNRFAEEVERKYEGIRNALAHAMVKANGERATEKDIDQYLKLIPIQTALTNGGVDSILAYTQTKAIAPAYNILQQTVEDLPEDQWIRGPVNKPFEKDMAEASATDKMNGQTFNTPLDDAQKLIEKPHGNSNSADAKDMARIAVMTEIRPTDEWIGFLDSHKDNLSEVLTPKQALIYKGQENNGVEWRHRTKPEISEASAGVAALYGLAKKNDSRAYEQLKHIAGYDDDGFSLPQSPEERAVRLFAQYEFAKLQGK